VKDDLPVYDISGLYRGLAYVLPRAIIFWLIVIGLIWLVLR
jgi:hypothetical protein